jgi:hypothetical protein
VLSKLGIQLLCDNEAMLREPVDSSTMKSVGYKAKSRMLEIEFDSGAVYQYLGVPARIHEELLGAESKGRYFNGEIRDVYAYVQVRGASG